MGVDTLSAYQGNDTPPGKGMTSLMIRNLPRSYTEEVLLAQLESAFGIACVDFLYMPWNFKRDCNIGYAFVNFVKDTDALEFFLNNSGRRWALEDATRPCCRIATAHVQGLAANVEHFAKMAVDLPQSRRDPIVYLNGIRENLWAVLPLAPRAVKDNEHVPDKTTAQPKTSNHRQKNNEHVPDKTTAQPKTNNHRQHRGTDDVRADGDLERQRSANLFTSGYGVETLSRSQPSSDNATKRATDAAQLTAKFRVTRFLPDEGSCTTPPPLHRQTSGCLTPPEQAGSGWSSCSTMSSETGVPSGAAARNQFFGVLFHL